MMTAGLVHRSHSIQEYALALLVVVGVMTLLYGEATDTQMTIRGFCMYATAVCIAGFTSNFMEQRLFREKSCSYFEVIFFTSLFACLYYTCLFFLFGDFVFISPMIENPLPYLFSSFSFSFFLYLTLAFFIVTIKRYGATTTYTANCFASAGCVLLGFGQLYSNTTFFHGIGLGLLAVAVVVAFKMRVHYYNFAVQEQHHDTAAADEDEEAGGDGAVYARQGRYVSVARLKEGLQKEEETEMHKAAQELLESDED
jgi:hypothetical protein